MLYFALAAMPQSDGFEVCSICGRPASIRDGSRLLCSTCALREVSPEVEEESSE